MNKGLKTQAVSDLLGVTRQTLRYWRENIDPFIKRRNFDGPAILAYRIISVCINKQGITAKELKESKLEVLFNECKKHRSELVNKVFIYNNIKKRVSFVDLDDPDINCHSAEVRTFALREIVREHVESMILMGSTPADIEITQNKQA